MNEEKQVEFIMKNVINFGKFSYNLQEKREEILFNQASRLTIGYPLAALVLSLINSGTTKLYTTTSLLGLAISLIFTILAGWRFKDRRMPGVDCFYKDVQNNIEKYENQYQFNAQWKSQLSLLHKSKEKINDIRANCILASQITFIVSSLLSTAFSLF